MDKQIENPVLEVIEHKLKEGERLYDRDSAPDYDRTKVVTASELGACIRKQWYSKRYPDEAFSGNGYARRGNAVERHIVESLSKTCDVINALDEQVTLLDPETSIAGTPDGYLILEIGGVMLEVKSVDPRTNWGNLPKAQHLTQCEVNLALAQLHLDLGTEIGTALMVYVDASNFDKREWFWVTVPGDDPRAYLDRVAAERGSRALRTRKVDRLDREGKKTGECKTCAFVDRCGVAVAGKADDSVTKSHRGSALYRTVAAYAGVNDTIKELEAEKKALGEDIKAELRKRNTPTTDVGEFAVTVAQMPGRSRLDKERLSAAMAAKGLELAEYESLGKPYEQLSVKLING